MEFSVHCLKQYSHFGYKEQAEVIAVLAYPYISTCGIEQQWMKAEVGAGLQRNPNYRYKLLKLQCNEFCKTNCFVPSKGLVLKKTDTLHIMKSNLF